MQPTREQAFEKLDEIENIQPDQIQDGSIPPRVETIDIVRKIIEDKKIDVPFLSVAADGEIVLRWGKRNPVAYASIRPNSIALLAICGELRYKFSAQNLDSLCLINIKEFSKIGLNDFE